MRYRSNSILALIPPTVESEPFISAVLHFNKPLKMRIFFLNVLNISTFKKFFQAQKVEKLKEEARKQLNKLLDNVIHKDIPFELIPRIKTGKTLDILQSESKKGGYEFMAIGKNTRFLTPAEIDKIVSRAFCPVLVLNKNHSVESIKKIVVPIDISQSTKKRLLWTSYFAKKFGATVHIVSALNIEMEETKSLAYRNADKIRNMLNVRGVECDVKVLKVYKKEKTQAILDFINEENPDMVVIRTHQASLTGAQIGRFVSTIVHECKMPVFTVGRTTHPLPMDFEQ